MSVNKVMILGRMGRDPELRHTPSQTAVVNLSLATTDYWTDKSGKKEERTEWHSVVVWGKSAEYVANYAKKGAQVFVEGSLQTREYQDKNGAKAYKTEVKADRVQVMGTSSPEERPGTMATPKVGKPQPVQPAAEFDEDSIPF